MHLLTKPFWTNINMLCVMLSQRMIKDGRKPLPFRSLELTRLQFSLVNGKAEVMIAERTH